VQRIPEGPFPARGAFLVILLLIATVIFWFSLSHFYGYTNRFARYWLIAGGAAVLPTSSMFAIDWGMRR
jgi:drug/metabolite transporter (DMT)-like permease